MTKHYRIVNHGRFITFVVIVMIIMTCLINMILGLNTAHSMVETAYMDYEIMSGQTLWSIAEMYMPEEIDIRDAVYQLCCINDITASDLKAGMTIKIPIYH